MKSNLPRLYVRRHNFYTDITLRLLGSGPNQSYEITVEYENPGWIAFDFAADVEDSPDGSMAEGRVDFYVNNIHRFRARGSYTFTRIYVYVDRGKNKFKWVTNEDFQSADRAWLRRIDATHFEEAKDFSVIQEATPPRPLNEINRHAIINGYDRFQQSGPGGVEIEMTMTFVPTMKKNENDELISYSGAENYMNFIGDFPNFYVLEYNYGLYGGTLMDPEPANQGPLTHVNMLFHSPQRVSAKSDKEFLEL